jgi:hypothetical protein
VSEHKVKVWAGRSSNGVYGIRIEDVKSGVAFVEIELTGEQFAEMITSKSTDGLASYRALDRVGLRAEHKTECVPFHCYRQYDDEAAQTAALAPFEVDGWRAQRDDLRNGHRTVKDVAVPTQRVTFHRHVHDDGTPYIAATQGGSGQ